MPSFPLSYYASGLIQILHYISDELVQCDSGTRIGELFNDEFDDLDFELALTCFEATYKLAFRESFWKVEIDDYEDKTIEEFLETYLDPGEQTDPLFITKRFLFFEKSLSEALREEYEAPPPQEF
jgi:hypothetical protein